MPDLSGGSEESGPEWTRQSVACEPRLSEAVELYRSLGLEVKLVPVGAQEAGASCTACFSADGDPGRYQVIYTRPKEKPENASGSADGGLFGSRPRSRRSVP